MKKRFLGKSGIEVSELSFGTVSLGVPYGIGISGKNEMISETDAIDLLRSALDQGINFFDTARGYGCSEERIGKAFKGRRDDAVICTKCTNLYKDKKCLPADNRLETIIETSIQESLSALQTDYVDVYMVHNADLNILNNQTIMEIFSEYRKKGIARAIGVSTYSVEETRTAIESGVWDVVQLAYNLMDQRHSELFSLAEQNGVGIVVRSVLFKGILTDRGRNLHPALKLVEQHRASYSELFNEKITTLSDLATKFVLSQKEVSSVLVGIDKHEYLEHALSVADGTYLDEKTLKAARNLAYPDPNSLDLPMWEKNGWLT